MFLFTFFCENFKKFFDSLDAWLPLDDQFFFKEKSIIKSSWLVMMSDGSIIKIPDDQFSAFLGKIYRCDLIWPGGPGSSPTNKYREAHEEINFCVIPSCVLNIPARYFYRSWNLFGISIPEGVSSIGEEAFSHCHLLWKINLPSSLSVIEKRTFMHCASLDNLTLHGGITTIKDEAFYNCSLVEGIKFPRSLTTIGNRAFFDCYLDSIEIPPKQFKFIGEDAFTCRGVRTVTIYDCDVSFEYPIFRSLSNFVLFVPEPFFNDIITGDLESFKTFLKKLGFEDYTLEFLPIGFPMPNFDDFVRHENHFIEFRDYSNLFANKVYDHDLVRTPFFYEEGAVVEF